MFWEDTRQPVERGSECRATHTYTLATALTPLPRWRGLPRESPLQCLRACRCTYVRTYVPWYHGTLVPYIRARTHVRTYVPWYTCTVHRVLIRSSRYVRTYTCTYMCTSGSYQWYGINENRHAISSSRRLERGHMMQYGGFTMAHTTPCRAPCRTNTRQRYTCTWYGNTCKTTWFSVHMCALFQSESCDITL